ncbi:MaoC/PaaZ C-terminal domain-containing protein, partial [Chloroflexota bacterium]
MIWKYFDELEIGEKFVTRGRTMTETDVINFCMLTGNWLELHSNIEYAKNTQFGQRLVQGS